MGLIARHIEAAGLPTLSLTSALSITAAAQPPRGAFVDYPLGHTSGKADDRDDQLAILRGAFDAFEKIDTPGTITDLGRRWSDDQSWRINPMGGGPEAKSSGKTDDTRTARHDTPQYQTVEDEALARDRHGDDACLACVGFDH